MLRYFIYFILFANIGVALEVFFTSIGDMRYLPKKKKMVLKGRSGLVMFPIYGISIFIVMLVRYAYPDWNIFQKGLIIVPLMFLWEYVAGWSYRKIFGYLCWDYDGKYPSEHLPPRKFSINGLVALEFLPIWYFEVVIAQIVLAFLDSHLIL